MMYTHSLWLNIDIVLLPMLISVYHEEESKSPYVSAVIPFLLIYLIPHIYVRGLPIKRVTKSL